MTEIEFLKLGNNREILDFRNNRIIKNFNFIIYNLKSLSLVKYLRLSVLRVKIIYVRFDMVNKCLLPENI